MMFNSNEHIYSLTEDGLTDSLSDYSLLSKPSSIRKGCYPYQWLDNGDMHLLAKFDQNIPCGSSVMSIYSLTEDGQTHIVIIVQTQGSCDFISLNILGIY